jgi:hypothetical protein
MPVAPKTVLPIGLIAACGLIVAFQGWRTRAPDEDIVASMVRTIALVERGAIPRRGNPTDLNAFRPPGTSWLLVPGVVLFDDPRLIEMAATGLLYLAAVAGVFAVAAHFFSRRVAVIAVLVYAFSGIAIHSAGVLQPRAHPAFIVWMTYCAAQWVARRDSGWLAAASVVYAAGMYSHLEMTPFGAMLPAVWWRYRPPVTWRPLAVAAALVMLMWSPYLAFQVERGFLDLGSQLLLRPVDARSPITIPFCAADPFPGAELEPRDRVDTRAVSARLASIADFSLQNVSSRLLAGEFVLLMLTIVALVVALVRNARVVLWREYRWPAIAFAGFILISEVVVRWMMPAAGVPEGGPLFIRRLIVWVIFAAGLAFSFDARTARVAAELRATWRRGDEAGVLALAILVPSVILLLLSPPGESRVLGVWSLQAVAIAGLVDAAATRVGDSRPWAWAAVPLVIVIAATNGQTLQRARDWRAHGWSGADRHVYDWAAIRQTRCEDER